MDKVFYSINTSEIPGELSHANLISSQVKIIFVIFGNLPESLEIFGKCSEIFGKCSEIFGKSSKKSSLIIIIIIIHGCLRLLDRYQVEHEKRNPISTRSYLVNKPLQAAGMSTGRPPYVFEV